MKLIITESQYNRLFLKEEKEVNFNYDGDTILAFGKLIGLPYKGQNSFLADRAIKNKNVLSTIYNIMNSADSKQNMIDDLNNKGMTDADNKLHDNIETIVKNFNSIAKENGFDKSLNLNVVLNKILRKQNKNIFSHIYN